jgi:hypothetical protein
MNQNQRGGLGRRLHIGEVKDVEVVIGTEDDAVVDPLNLGAVVLESAHGFSLEGFQRLGCPGGVRREPGEQDECRHGTPPREVPVVPFDHERKLAAG